MRAQISTLAPQRCVGASRLALFELTRVSCCCRRRRRRPRCGSMPTQPAASDRSVEEVRRETFQDSGGELERPAEEAKEEKKIAMRVGRAGERASEP